MALTGKLSSMSMTRIISPGSGTDVVDSGYGSLLNMSIFSRLTLDVIIIGTQGQSPTLDSGLG